MVISDAVTGLGLGERIGPWLHGGVFCPVYVAAFVAEQGQSLRDMIGGRLWPWILADVHQRTGPFLLSQVQTTIVSGHAR
jgi:hypothetical protein